MGRAQPLVTGFERVRTWAPWTGRQRRAVSPGECHELIERLGRSKWAERAVWRRLWAARTEIWRREPQRPAVNRERDVVGRSAPLDFVRLEERRLERSGCDVERDRACLRQHLEQSLGHAVLLPKVAVDAVMERRRLADIQNTAVCPKHAIDARRTRQGKPHVTRHRPDTPSTPGRLGGCGEPIVERAPCEYALRLQQADQLLPDERRRFDVVGAAAQCANGATEV